MTSSPKYFSQSERKNNIGKQNKLLIKIITVAVNGLENMYDFEQQMFCNKVIRTAKNVAKQGLSYRYTIISALGLHQYETVGNKSPISMQNILSKLIEKANTIDSIGDLGLLLWLCALSAPAQLTELFKKLKIDSSFCRFKDAQQGLTVELAWFLTGLSHATLALDKVPEKWKNLAIKTSEFLIQNYYGKGLFGHSFRSSIGGRIRGKIGCFADQVYPIYALSTFAKAFNRDALKPALECADKICQLQGPLGQWWWHYDALAGKMLGQYPVFATHQNGMAPMALFAISQISGIDFTDSIFKGLKWINKNNELESNLIDNSQNVIWRSIYKNKYKMYYDELLSFSGIKKNNNNRKHLKINLECRPYHLGWILYAFSNKL